MSQFFGDSIFWIEVDKIKPNPYQPRREFDEARLKDLADSIRMYGVLQPLVVTRREVSKEDGGLSTEYELISGERRLRASKLAGVREVPAIIRADTDDGRLKLELAIIENLQREDLNPIDRARAFKQLHEEFKFKHGQIAEKVGKSREYVSNSIRLLELPQEILKGLEEGKLTEGHARSILMLNERPEEQMTLFREVTLRKLTVRETEHIARNIAVERARRPDRVQNTETFDIETRLSEVLGTRVRIEHKGDGGRIHIDFFSDEDLRTLLSLVGKPGGPKIGVSASQKTVESAQPLSEEQPSSKAQPEKTFEEKPVSNNEVADEITPVAPTSKEIKDEPLIDDRPPQEVKEDEEELYSIKNFSL